MLNALTDDAICSEIGKRLERVRLDQNVTQAQLADNAGISKRTLERLENGKSVQLTSFIRVCRELDLIERLDSLIPESIPSPIDQIRLQGKKRRRASSDKTESGGSSGVWTWGDKS